MLYTYNDLLHCRVHLIYCYMSLNLTRVHVERLRYNFVTNILRALYETFWNSVSTIMWHNSRDYNIVKYETIPKIHIKVTVYLRLNQTDHFRTKSCVTCEQSRIIMETHNSTHTDQFPYLFFYLLIHLPPPSLHPNSPFPYLAPSHYCYVRRMKCNQRPKWVPHVLLRSVFIESFSRSVCFHELLYCIYLSYNHNPLIIS